MLRGTVVGAALSAAALAVATATFADAKPPTVQAVLQKVRT